MHTKCPTTTTTKNESAVLQSQKVVGKLNYYKTPCHRGSSKQIMTKKSKTMVNKKNLVNIQQHDKAERALLM